MEKNIYILNACDEWKSHSSSRLIMASTDSEKIRDEIRRRIKEGDMDYLAAETDLDNLELYQLDAGLRYGSIAIVEDGEVC